MYDYQIGKANNIDSINASKLVLWCEYISDGIIDNIFETFRKKYIQRGKNGFEGDLNDMKTDICNLLIIDASRDKNKAVVIANYGYENMEYVNEAYANSVVRSSEAIQKYIVHKHFNPEHPENHNIRLIKKNFYMKMNDRWQIFTIRTLVNKLFNDACRDLSQKQVNYYTYFHHNFEENKKNIISDTKGIIKYHLYNETRM